MTTNNRKTAQQNQAKKRAFVVSSAYKAMLFHIYTYHFLLVRQIMRLGSYAEASLGWVQDHLKTLTEEGYVHRPKRPHTETGKAPYIYCLSQKGMAYMADWGYSLEHRFRPGEHKQPSDGYLKHLEKLNDVLITASFLPHQVPSFRLLMHHEWMMRQWGKRTIDITVEEDGVARTKKRSVHLDAFLRFYYPDDTSIPILLEVDNGTETNKWDFKEKLQALLLYFLGPYTDLFDTPYGTISFLTTAGTARRDQMLSWCEEMLVGLREEDKADLFRFCALPDGQERHNPRTLFLSPIWYRPFDFFNAGAPARGKVYSQPMPLLEMP
jgi:hypothetical protein